MVKCVAKALVIQSIRTLCDVLPSFSLFPYEMHCRHFGIISNAIKSHNAALNQQYRVPRAWKLTILYWHSPSMFSRHPRQRHKRHTRFGDTHGRLLDPSHPSPSSLPSVLGHRSLRTSRRSPTEAQNPLPC